ncbi:hypothetical protein I3760_14G124200 [Carya illinoinensis]|nr:hypothetical protein I3760_14G124200 [Carya illinoinensis]
MDSGEESDDDLGVGDGERSLPEEYSAFYKREVSKSEGFDVPEIIAGYLYNLIQPRDLDYIYEECTQLAIDEYNRRFASVQETMGKNGFGKAISLMVIYLLEVEKIFRGDMLMYRSLRRLSSMEEYYFVFIWFL